MLYFTPTQTHCAAQGNKVIFSISSEMKDLNINVKTRSNFFYTYVKSVLSYGAEIWEFHNGIFCKSVLGVRIFFFTCNSAVYYELGRFPLEIFRNDRKNSILLQTKKQ